MINITMEDDLVSMSICKHKASQTLPPCPDLTATQVQVLQLCHLPGGRHLSRSRSAPRDMSWFVLILIFSDFQ